MTAPLIVAVHDTTSEPLIADCMAVMTTAFPPCFGEAWTAPQLSSMMVLPGAALITGRLGDTVIGFGLLRAIAQEAELLLLAVDPAYRGMGHGRRILDRCLIFAECHEAQSVFLEVRRDNPAVHLYSKAGFNQYNERRDYYVGSDGTRFDALSFKVSLVQN